MTGRGKKGLLNLLFFCYISIKYYICIGLLDWMGRLFIHSSSVCVFIDILKRTQNEVKQSLFHALFFFQQPEEREKKKCFAHDFKIAARFKLNDLLIRTSIGTILSGNQRLYLLHLASLSGILILQAAAAAAPAAVAAAPAAICL